MIHIKDTKNMIGITIHGDYEDLKTLHRALSDYLRFYFEHQEDPVSYNCYETILGLCYDIRHAFQGDRNIESVENNHENLYQLASCIYQVDEKAIEKERKKYKNGNLYFNVEVLYPWAVYYLFTLQAITDDVYELKWFQDDKYHYTEYQAEHDLALINYFVHLLWERLRDHLSEEELNILWNYTRLCNHIEYYFDYPDTYMEWLCTYWVNAFPHRIDRHLMLPLVCLELSSILDESDFELEEYIQKAEEHNKKASGKSESLHKNKNTDHDNATTQDEEFQRQVANIQASIAQTTLRGLHIYDDYYDRYSIKKRGTKYEYQCQDEFLDNLYDYVNEHGQLTEESFDSWLEEELGTVSWDSLEW